MKVYVFTNYGLVKGVIINERKDKFTGRIQYKLKIDVNREVKGKDYNYWFNKEQLNRFYFTAIVFEMFKPFSWFVKSLFKAKK